MELRQNKIFIMEYLPNKIIVKDGGSSNLTQSTNAKIIDSN